MSRSDVIDVEVAKTLPGLFCERLKRGPEAVAYRHYDKRQRQWRDLSWAQMAAEISRWQAAIRGLGLSKGDRVAVMAVNSPAWIMYEQAALGLGLVVVPLFFNDRADNIAYVLADSGSRLLLLQDKDQWQELSQAADQLSPDLHIWGLEDCADARVQPVAKLLADVAADLELAVDEPDALATIVYTSGTTGRPKGVMLSHRNILWNCHAGMRAVAIYPEDSFLSFLPLSHTLERSIGYYLPMMAGASVAFARSVPHLAEDLLTIRPTVLISVPRIYERVQAKINEQLSGGIKAHLFHLAVAVGWARFLHQQGRAAWQPKLLCWPLLRSLVADKVMAKLGGRLRVAISGGAPMPEDTAKLFVGLGLNLLQGYGMTESSPVLSVNQTEANEPASVGLLLPDVEAKTAENGELLARSPGVMLGYWNHPEASAETVDPEGWLHTGDIARLDGDRVFITGRLKDVIVLANGEKVPPADMEMAIGADPLFEQVMVLGEGRPFLTALVVLADVPRAKQLDEAAVLARLCEHIKCFPGYAQIRRVALIDELWSVENDMLTPTLKLKRANIMARYSETIESLYKKF